MKKVTSNVQLVDEANAGDKMYELQVRVGEYSSRVLVEFKLSTAYIYVTETDTTFEMGYENIPFPFFDYTSLPMAAYLARRSLARAVGKEYRGIDYPFIDLNCETLVAIEYGIDDKAVVYNYLTDRVSKRRV